MKAPLSILLTVGFAVCVSAADGDGLGGIVFKDGPFVGAVFGGDVEQTGPAFGYQVAYVHGPRFSLELAGSWHEDESVSLSNRLPGVPVPGAVDLDVLAFALTARVALLPEATLSPYIGGGFAYYVLQADNEELRVAGAQQSVQFIEADPDQEFGTHLVIGVETILSPQWDVFAEYRHAFFDTGVKVTVNPNPQGVPQTGRDDLDYDHSMIRLGVNYRF